MNLVLSVDFTGTRSLTLECEARVVADMPQELPQRYLLISFGRIGVRRNRKDNATAAAETRSDHRSAESPHPGITTGLMAVAGDDSVSGFSLVRSSFTLSLILVIISCSPRSQCCRCAHPPGGLIAATVGLGGGAIWWALASPRYSLWLMLAMGACIALYSLAPVEVRRAHRPATATTVTHCEATCTGAPNHRDRCSRPERTEIDR